MSVRFLIEQFDQYREEGRTAYKMGNWDEARFRFLKAAETLLLAARESEPAFRKSRRDAAVRFCDLANRLKNRSPKMQAIDESTSAEDGAQIEGAAGAWVLRGKPDVCFNQIAGLDEVKQEFRLKVIYPIENPETASRYRKRGGGGVLMYGPPGTGKTMFAKAVAAELDAVFFSIKGSDIMSKWVGEAEKNVSQLFQTARRFPVSVIFIDEVEGLVGKRGSGSTVMDRVIPEFLSQMDGVEERKNIVLLLGATNKPWNMDEAALRPGRFDRQLYVGLPDFEARLHILTMNLEEIPIEDGIDLEEWAKKTEGYSGADIVAVCSKATDYPFERHINSAIEAKVTRSDLERAVEEVSPSVNHVMLRKYQKFKKNKSK